MTIAPRARVLLVDDEPSVRRTMARMLHNDFDVLTAEDGPTALGLLSTTRVDAMLLDVAMPPRGGIELLAQVKAAHPDVELVMLATHGDGEKAVLAVQQGAFSFVLKPIDLAEIVIVALKNAIERRKALTQIRVLTDRLRQHERFGELIGTSARMQDVYKRAVGVATSRTPVLLIGENGTGKELIARTIHNHSTRASKPFVHVDCAQVPEDSFDTELFGTVDDPASGNQRHPGLFETADKGTLLLDHLGHLPMAIQGKLVQVLVTGQVGSIQVDVRLIAATNADLKALVHSGKLREDLYYRVSIIAIHVPPLRQRKEDIPLLANYFLQRWMLKEARTGRRIGAETMRLLREHLWPGNVRELEHAIEHAAVMSRGDTILPADLPWSASSDPQPSIVAAEVFDLPYAQAKERAVLDFNKAYVAFLMQRTQGNMSEAARLAGMDRSNFRRITKKMTLGRRKDTTNEGND